MSISTTTHNHLRQSPTIRRTTIASVVMTLAAAALWPGQAAANQALVQKNACIACHQPAARVVGPSWKQITEKYSDGKITAEQLAASIKGGSSGKWGPMPMPPQAQVSDADLKIIAQWLLDGAK
ncbi:c-type cytochrome [Xanthomonas arboricola]|uniref:c-type cytochrome n=1 Tax=Xanthomonas arboricola TaxID=56448 RepID=UPI001610B2D0|nr:c-type cytochrome [Xanthomonas arboricola]MBB4596470.1 cytochrome c [Xanthomonas arboricola]